MTQRDLERWGESIGSDVLPPLWISLYGPLGAGKSVLVRAMCRGAGIEGPVPSPTFTLVQRYDSPRGFPIEHVDLFRLRARDSLEPLGWEELMRSPGLVAVEWADRAGGHQPAGRWEVRLDYDRDPGRRTVEAARIGDAPELVGW